MRKVLYMIAAAAFALSCSPEVNPEYTPKEPEKETVIDRNAFAKGADISWATQMENEGMKFYNDKGAETECTALMKQLGFNSIRLRVWVDPELGWCSAGDVLVKALRAQKEGMRIMIDFHYSDTWADPANQMTPAAWADYDIEQLKKAVTDHTVSVLTLLKENGVDVEWVQVGNETRGGMLWPLGKYENGKNYADLTTAGYDAAKSVYPECKVIVHLDSGNRLDLYQRIFPVLNNNGGKYDLIGMSLYPCTWSDDLGGYPEDWKTATDNCLNNITNVFNLYGKNVVICEVGMPVSKPEASKEMLTYFLAGAKESGHCEGVFYWEPQAPEGYSGGYGLGAFQNGKATIALDPFRNQ